MKFAKLFEKNGKQVLVKVDQGDDEKPEVSFFFKPKGLGVCSIAMECVGDSEESWEKANKFLDEIGEEKAFDFVEECSLLFK